MAAKTINHQTSGQGLMTSTDLPDHDLTIHNIYRPPKEKETGPLVTRLMDIPRGYHLLVRSAVC